MSTSSTTENLIITTAAVTAGVTVSALALVQTDAVSRMILGPDRLQFKRAQEYSYRWQVALDKASLQMNYFLAGGMSHFNSNPDCVALNTDFVRNESELLALADRIVKDKAAYFRVLWIDTDPHDPLKGFYVYLSEEDAVRNSPESTRGSLSIEDVPPSKLIQAPLASFCKILRKAFGDQITTTTMCFIADASSGAASSLIENLVSECKMGVAIASEPLWMASIAALADQKKLSTDVAEDALHALCRLESWRMRDMARDSKTVMFTLPGQASTPILLPLLQRIFPEERHVFAYDGCVSTVQRGIDEQKKYARSATLSSLRDCTSMAHNPIRHTTPLVRKHIMQSVSGLTEALSKVPISQAQVVENWITSVDGYFKLKAEETSNGYLPYVFKYSFLVGPNLSFEPQKGDAYWSLASLLQFITGCRSRPLPEGMLDAAAEWLKDFNVTTGASSSAPRFSESESKAIENCVFKHKSILIGNKTLQDTVLPKQHWTLKQASRKGGCACCAPEEDEEEEEEKGGGLFLPTPGGGKVDMNVPGAFAAVLTPAKPPAADRPKYVDGKMGFAFDPTNFRK